MLMLGPLLVALADDFGTSIAGADRAGRIALDKLQTLASHAGTTRGDPVESAVTPAIAETEDVKGLPSLPMAVGPPFEWGPGFVRSATSSSPLIEGWG